MGYGSDTDFDQMRERQEECLEDEKRIEKFKGLSRVVDEDSENRNAEDFPIGEAITFRVKGISGERDVSYRCIEMEDEHYWEYAGSSKR